MAIVISILQMTKVRLTQINQLAQERERGRKEGINESSRIQT